MTIPAWILDIFAAIMLLVAVVSAARLAAAPRWRGGDTDVDVAHLLMAIAMAGTLTASLATLPAGVWEVVFGVLTAWFAWSVYRETRASGARVLVTGCQAPHLVHSAAMVYMFLAVSAPAAAGHGGAMGGMAGSAMPTLRLPTLAFVFTLLLAGYAVRDLDLLSGAAADRRYLLSGPAIAPAGATLAAAPALGAPAVSTGGQLTAQPEPAAPDPAPPAGRAPGAARRLALTPGLETGCRIAMGVTMAFMLVIMI
jgi:hypothetical protein